MSLKAFLPFASVGDEKSLSDGSSGPSNTFDKSEPQASARPCSLIENCGLRCSSCLSGICLLLVTRVPADS